MPSRGSAWAACGLGFPLGGCCWALGPGSWLPWERLTTFAAGNLVLLLILSCWTDLLHHKIYNWITYPAFLWALTINVVVSVATGGEAGQHESTGWARLGGVGVASCLSGAIVCFFALLVVYQLSGSRGAGDVKLATALGAWLGLLDGVTAIFFTYIVAGVVLACWVIILAGPQQVLSFALRKVGSLLLPGWVMPPPEQQLPILKRPVAMAAFFAAGTMLTLLGVFEP
jgi:Flp pilus assembly protein protease CpaA